MHNFVFLLVIAFCGTCTSSLNIESLNRIAGGITATNGNQFRYMISLQQKNQINSLARGHRCGGALVSLRHAVTAASCLYDSPNGVHTLLNADDYRVFAGVLDLTNDASADHHRDVERFTVHPNYNPGTPYVNDIAVITLTSAFSTNTVRILNLWNPDDIHVLTPCTSSGWGSQNDANIPSTQLMQLQKTTLDNNSCQPFFTTPFGPEITLQSSMVCAIWPFAPSSSCKGDIGNPLVCSGSLYGILVHTAYSSCSAEMLITRPEIYTRISSFRTWIQATAGGSTL